RPSGSQARGTWALRDHPALLWMLLAVTVAVLHQWVPGATWLMVHLVLLGALTHSIFVWSTHFAQALLKTPDALDTRPTPSRHRPGDGRRAHHPVVVGGRGRRAGLRRGAVARPHAGPSPAPRPARPVPGDHPVLPVRGDLSAGRRGLRGRPGARVESDLA